MHIVYNISVQEAPLYINTVYCKALYKSCTIHIVFTCKYYHFEYLITKYQNLGLSIDIAATNQHDVGIVADTAECSTPCSANAKCKLWIFLHGNLC